MISIFSNKPQQSLPLGKSVVVRSTERFTLMSPLSGLALLSQDPRIDPLVLTPTAGEYTLGRALLRVFDGCEALAPSVVVTRMSDMAARQERYSTGFDRLRHQFNYASPSEVFSGMRLCYATLDAGKITLAPTSQESIDMWEGLGDPALRVVLPAESAPEAIGKALLKTLSRCNP